MTQDLGQEQMADFALQNSRTPHRPNCQNICHVLKRQRAFGPNGIATLRERITVKEQVDESCLCRS